MFFIVALFSFFPNNNIPSCFERCVFFSSGGSSLCACHSLLFHHHEGIKKLYMRVDGGEGNNSFFSRGRRRKIIKLAKFFSLRAYLARLYVHMYYVVRLKSSLTCCLLEQILKFTFHLHINMK